MDKNVINGRTLLADIMETDLTTISFKNWGRTVCQMHEHSNNDEYQDTNAPCVLDHFFFLLILHSTVKHGTCQWSYSECRGTPTSRKLQRHLQLKTIVVCLNICKSIQNTSQGKPFSLNKVSPCKTGEQRHLENLSCWYERNLAIDPANLVLQNNKISRVLDHQET